MTVIYEAKDDKPHFCTTANASLPVGSICQCDCGRFWLRKTVIGDYWVYRWVPVRWYHRTARKRITEWKQQRRIRPIVQSIIATGEPQTLTNKTIVNPTVQESIYAKLRDTVPGEGYVPLDPQGRVPVEDKKAAMMEQMAQAKEKVKADSRKLYLTRAGADGEQEWREADDTTPTKFRVTANVYPSPFAEKTCAVCTWTGTRFQIGEMAGEYADESDNPLLHMEIDTVEVLDE